MTPRPHDNPLCACPTCEAYLRENYPAAWLEWEPFALGPGDRFDVDQGVIYRADGTAWKLRRRNGEL